MPVQAGVSSLISPFVNEAYRDFSKSDVWTSAQAALAKVRGELGREYPLWIAGQQHKTGDFLISTNPSYPSEIVARAHKATATLAAHAIEDAAAFFPEWRRTAPEFRADLLFRTAALLRERKYEFDAWLVVEAGKTWPEAEAEIAEAIDFCEYYGREMLRFAHPPKLVQLPGERDEMVYLPLGVGVIIPPWNFPLAILAGMTVAALVAGNTVIIKPSSETPVIAHKFAQLLREAGFPARSFSLCVGSGAVVGGCSGGASGRLASSLSPARAMWACGSTELAAKPRAGTDLDQARRSGDGRQGRHHRGSRSGFGKRGRGRGAIGVWILRAKVFGLFARDCRRSDLRRVSAQAPAKGGGRRLL